jgi:hypothetical protein
MKLQIQFEIKITDNKIYTHKGDMITACGTNKDAGSKCHLSNLI